MQVEQLLAKSESKLEQLQREFEHFVPAEVVERLTGAMGVFTPQRSFVRLCDC